VSRRLGVLYRDLRTLSLEVSETFAEREHEVIGVFPGSELKCIGLQRNDTS